MFKITVLFVLFVGCMNSAPLSTAPEKKATKQECVTKCKEAAQMVSQKGIEATLEAINNQKGPFVWKDSYVFCVNIVSQQIAAHPFRPDIIGMQIDNITDANGKVFFAELIHAASKKVNTKGEGWLTYMWSNPDTNKPMPKITFIYKVPGHQYLMAAGIFK